MADEIHNIKIKIDDSDSKRFDAEEKKRLRVQEAAEKEAEKRKTMAFKDALEQKKEKRKQAYNEAKKQEEELARQQKRLIDEQIKNVNRLADAEKKRIDDVNKKAANNLRQATTNNNIQSTLGGRVGNSVNEIRAQVNELKKFRDGLVVNDPAIARINQRIRELRTNLTGLTSTTKTSSAQLLEMGENMATIGIALKLGAMQLWAMIQPLKNFAVNSIKTGAELNILRSSFRGSTQDIELFKKATSGTVTEASLIKLSNQATDLGLTLE